MTLDMASQTAKVLAFRPPTPNCPLKAQAIESVERVLGLLNGSVRVGGLFVVLTDEHGRTVERISLAAGADLGPPL